MVGHTLYTEIVNFILMTVASFYCGVNLNISCTVMTIRTIIIIIKIVNSQSIVLLINDSTAYIHHAWSYIIYIHFETLLRHSKVGYVY